MLDISFDVVVHMLTLFRSNFLFNFLLLGHFGFCHEDQPF